MSDENKKREQGLERLNRELAEANAELERTNASLGEVVRILDEKLPAIKAEIDKTKEMGDGFLMNKDSVLEFLRMKSIAHVRDLDDEGMRELREFLERKLSFLRAANEGKLQ